MPSQFENIQIDVSRVPIDKQALPDFQRKMRELRRDLANPTTMEACCIHEAGHLIYFRRAGLDPSLSGPMIMYDEACAQFRHGLAWVKPDLRAIRDLNAFAKGVAAGGVFTRVIAGQEYLGHSGDLDVFRGIVKHRFRFNGPTAHEILRTAISSVEEDVGEPESAVRGEIPTAIAEIKDRCFGIRMTAPSPN
jgi:hypothetical protein